jgi:hypothetical protein
VNAHRHTDIDIDVHEPDFRVHDQDGEPLAVIPRTSGKEVTRTRGYGVPTEWARNRHPSPGADLGAFNRSSQRAWWVARIS